MLVNQVLLGDSLELMQLVPNDSIDVIYLDPPFFTQETQVLKTRDNKKEYIFDDKWSDIFEYISYMDKRLRECYRVLKETGSIFLHCDRNAVHYLKVCMDKIFGFNNFQSEIIWYYKRWSNSKKGLLNNHQVILFYSKSLNFKFNKIYTDYSLTTNVDQILQDRIKDENGKSKYKLDENGEAIIKNQKKGVPLSDVWEIPFLNPKAKERVGYPTQKPVILIEQILKLVTEENDILLDPFVGSGTSLVAAKLLNRNYLGMDISKDAVELANERLNKMVKTESHLVKKGKNAYLNLSNFQMQILKEINAKPVQRNSGIDGFLSEYINGKPITVKIQKDDESFYEAIEKLVKSSKSKKCEHMILFRTHADIQNINNFDYIPKNIIVIDIYDLQIKEKILKVNEQIEDVQIKVI